MTRSDHDIKAPDGYVLGGLRKVRKDGSILFQRGYWEIPDEFKDSFIGEKVWVHEAWIGRWGNEGVSLEVAHPGLHIYEARPMKMTVIAERNSKPDAKSIARTAHRKAWFARADRSGYTCECGGDTHPDEAACIECGRTKEWAQG